MNNSNLYNHHQRRLMALIDASTELHDRLYNKENNYWNDNPEDKPLKKRLWRLQQLASKASYLRDRYASTDRWTPYRAWPY